MTTRCPEGAGSADRFRCSAPDRVAASETAAPTPTVAVLRKPLRSILYVLIADTPF